MKLLLTYFWKRLPIGDLISLTPISLAFSKSSQIGQSSSNHLKREEEGGCQGIDPGGGCVGGRGSWGGDQVGWGSSWVGAWSHGGKGDGWTDEGLMVGVWCGRVLARWEPGIWGTEACGGGLWAGPGWGGAWRGQVGVGPNAVGVWWGRGLEIVAGQD